MKLLITGAAGFIGSNYVRRTVDGTLPGASEITVLDKLTYAGTLTNLASLSRDSFRFVEGDICDAELVQRLCKGTDAIINFAAESHVDRSIRGAREFITTNVLGTQTLLDCARRENVKSFIQISTDEVYGSIDQGSWSEKEPLLPNSPYSASKACADLIARAYHRTFGMDVRITRCSNNYGPHQFPEKIIPLFITNIIEGLRVPVYGSGNNVRDWLHVDDHCRAINLVLNNGRPGDIYNIGGGRELTNLELTKLILDEMGVDESHIQYVPDRRGHDHRYSVNIAKATAELGYEPKIKFEDGLSETIDWYQENQRWWRSLKK